MRVLLAIVLLGFLSPTWAESKHTDAKSTSVHVYFRIVIPARARSAKLFNPALPLSRGEVRQERVLADGTRQITLVRP